MKIAKKVVTFIKFKISSFVVVTRRHGNASIGLANEKRKDTSEAAVVRKTIVTKAEEFVRNHRLRVRVQQ